MNSELCQVCVKSPSYIREILRKEDRITLVYRKKEVPFLKEEEVEDISVNDSNNTLDLTGNPLMVDLKCDSKVNLSFVIAQSNNWTEEEKQHFPITLKEARNIINIFNKSKVWCDTTNVSSYIYCVCDGTDKNCIIILGANICNSHFSRTQVFVKDCFVQSDPLIDVETMVKEHNEHVGTVGLKVNSKVTSSYEIYGCNLKKCNISNNLEYTGSILLELTWNVCQYKIPKYVNSVEMTLQAIIGHTDSQVYMFWQQLTLLQKFITILSTKSNNFERITISSHPMDFTEITSKLYSILNEFMVCRPALKRELEKASLNISELREESLMDKLWNLFICCNNIGDLKACFHILFEELAANRSLKINIPDHNKTMVAGIVSDILFGKLAVPTLSSVQALEFLIELGTEKLKNDYYYIINYFDCSSYEKLINSWNKAIGEVKTENKSVTKASVNRMPPRSTYFTLQSMPSIINVSVSKMKFNCLVQMHKATEFLLLAKRYCSKRQETLSSIIVAVNDQLLNTDNVTGLLSSLPEYMLSEMKVDLASNNTNLLDTESPTSWNLNLTSVNNNSVVTTIFHLTSKPLFPPSIWNKYDVPADSLNSPIYYVTKLVNYIDNLS